MSAQIFHTIKCDQKIKTIKLTMNYSIHSFGISWSPHTRFAGTAISAWMWKWKLNGWNMLEFHHHISLNVIAQLWITNIETFPVIRDVKMGEREHYVATKRLTMGILTDLNVGNFPIFAIQVWASLIHSIWESRLQISSMLFIWERFWLVFVR